MMAPLYDFICTKCGFEFEHVVSVTQVHADCPHCENPRTDRLPPIVGGYKINGDNSASQRPKGAGSRPRSK